MLQPNNSTLNRLEKGSNEPEKQVSLNVINVD